MSLGRVVCRPALLHTHLGVTWLLELAQGHQGVSLLQHSPLSPAQNPSLAGLPLTEAWDNP